MRTFFKKTNLLIAAALLFQVNLIAQNFGKAVLLNGTSNYITVPNTANYLESSNFTFECWAKRSTAVSRSGKDRLMMAVSTNGWGVLIENNKIKLTKVGVSECASKSTIADTNWHHIAVTHNGTIATFYLDGKADTSITYSNTFNSTGSYTIGSRGNNEFFEGSIDEVRVWNKVKASTDINTQRCIAIPVNESNLRAYYKFEEGTGTAIIDSTSNVNHGTISNGTNLWVNSSAKCASSGIFGKDLLDMGIFATTFNKAIQINIPENVDLTSNNEIQIYNIAGTLNYQGLINPSNRAYTVQSNEFSNGLYIVHVQTANGIYINKVMISE